MDDDNEDIFMTSIHDQYQARSDDLEDMCLADFATKYTAANDFSQGTSIIVLKNNLGKMRL